MTIKGFVGALLMISLLAWTDCASPRNDEILFYCNEFRQIQTDVRDTLISPDSARIAFKSVIQKIRFMYPRDSCRAVDSSYFVFPVRGYYPRESIGGKGRGYRDTGFDLFDMTAKGSHPAHDIFVRDKNQDNLVSVETNWKSDSHFRGGNWIWIYDPCLDGLFFYAHNNIVKVTPGQWVTAGEKIAEMGRSGFNAYKKRSPTHLHLMYLKLTPEGLPEPENTYDWLMMSNVKE